VIRRYALPAALVLLVVTMACRDATESTAPNQDQVPAGAVQAQAPSMEELASQVPGFGGFYIDGGRPTVFLTEMAGRGLAARALTPFIRGMGQDPSDLQVKRGEFNYRQLTLWFNAASPLALDMEGTVMVDLDEAHNRVLIGVESAANVGAVRSALMRAGLPDRALAVEIMRPIVRVASLQGAATPIWGGVQINFPGFLCTLGFNVVAGGQDSFITNSHCTASQGGVQNTPYYQPLQSSNPTVIATEVADPDYQRGLGAGCPRNKLCRFSDASRARYSTGYTNFQRGRIARPDALGSLNYSGSWSITGKGTAVVGQTLNKVGRTTGWTQGLVTNTCVNTGVQGTRFVQLCQFFVSAGVGAGDSGSPVFQITGTSSVLLMGILWGSGGGTFVGSPIGQIEQELGPLTVN